MADPNQLLDNLRAAGKDWYAAPAGSVQERAAADRIAMGSAPLTFTCPAAALCPVRGCLGFR